MRKLLLLLSVVGIMSADVMASSATHIKGDSHLCKLFQKKAIRYKKTMRHDDYAKTTLASYQKRAKLFCLEGK